PFTLTGILFFPKIKNNIEVTKNRIQLYCNQVYVTDSVEGVVPEFMMLMQGVIDSPDIPLNVSRSYLQSDTAVKKISSYITKKVAQRLEDIFKNDRSDYEQKWDDIKIFIEYGMLTDQKFADSAMKFVLLKDSEGKYYTPEEYKLLVEAAQTDKDGDIIYLYATDPTAQYSYIKAATDRGYSVLVMDGQLDSHFVGLLESKLEKTRFVRVDSDVLDNLIRRDNKRDVELTPLQRNILTTAFRSQVPQVEKADFLVSFEALNAADQPIVITQNEYMRRMKDMAAMQPGMSFYADMPDSYNLVVNTEHPLVQQIRDAALEAVGASVEPLAETVEKSNSEITALRDAAGNDKQPDAETQQKINELEKTVADARESQDKIVSEYAAGQPLIKQLIDLALLGNGLLRGQALSDFISRSVSLLK
ncbi:MAG: molecular chaperone HtpG, partial [Muribaculaceae bacterium]|nr:molecular chaperone HtpG [Muribaculaceae bacterium]